MTIEIKNVSKTFGNFHALRDIGLTIAAGELVALLGPSGSGKTTLLRIIAGLESPDAGDVTFFGEDARDKKTRDRRVGFVFQHYALFRHMTVFDNIAFGLRVKPKPQRPSNEQIRLKVRELLKLVQLEWVENRFPWQLSGGQRQRIALARALAVEPKILLLDEPFGSLDAQVRKELRLWLRRLHDELHITSLFVTHDQEEALEVADRVVVMNRGAIEQIGTPDEVYHHPANAFVLNFLGNVNVFHGRVEEGKVVWQDQKLSLSGAPPDNVKAAGLYVRPHQFDLARAPQDASSLKAVVQHLHTVGSVVKVNLLTESGQPLQAELSQETFQKLKLVKSDVVYARVNDVTYTEYEI